MEPLSVFSLLFNLITYNPGNDINFKNDHYRYQSVYQVKQDIFNDSFKIIAPIITPVTGSR